MGPTRRAGCRLGADAAQLAGIVASVGARFELLPPASVSPEVQRRQLFDAVTGYVERASGVTPVLVVVEDLHWAAVATLDLLRHIVRLGRGRVLVVATCRDVPPDLTGPLTTFIADLGRQANTRRLSLTGLTTADIAELVRLDLPNADADGMARALHGLTDGSPLFVKELLASHGHTDMAMLSPPFRLSPTLRDVVAARFARLRSVDDPILDAAAVLGTGFEAGLLADIVDLPIETILDTLNHAEALGLVKGVPGDPGRFSFTHDLLREVRYAQIPASRRLRLHQQTGRALANRSTDDAHVVDLAHHFCAAASIGEADRAVHFARHAGEVARACFAFADAAEFFARAERAASFAGHRDLGLLCDLAISRGEALHRGGDTEHRAVLLEAARLAQQLGDPDRLAAAALALNEQGWTLGVGTLDDDMCAVTNAALAGLPPQPSRTRARLLAMLAAALNLTSLHQRSRDLGADALATARQLDDPATLAEVLVTAHWALFDPENLEERFGIADQVETLADQLDDPVLRLQALLMRAPDLREAGDLHQGNRVSRRAAALADELGLPFFGVLGRQGWAAQMEGRLDDAERQVGEALARAADIGLDATAVLYPIVFSLLIDRGRWEELIEALPPLVTTEHGLPAYRAALAMVLARCGHVEEARHHVDRFTATDFTLMPRNIQWTAGMVALADAITHLDDAAAATRLRGLLAPLSGRTPWQDHICMWPVDLALGQLAAVVGDREAALRHIAAAEATSARCETPIHLARCHVHRAWVLSRTPRAGMGTRVRALLDEAFDMARPLGAHGVIREAELLGLDDRSGLALRVS